MSAVNPSVQSVIQPRAVDELAEIHPISCFAATGGERFFCTQTLKAADLGDFHIA
jgi:hypothetical protein